MIKWSPDDAYIKSGESQVVPSYASISQVLDTLRVFTTPTNNCYSIEVDTGEKVLVRATFYYGNYDSKFVPPTFDVQLNGKYWATVEADLTNGVYTYYEAIYVVEGGNISVCLVQTFDSQYPFISALELRSLDATMYGHRDANRPLYVSVRTFGSNTEYVRYPDDIYDRMWHPTILIPTISNSSLIIDVKVEDNPPEAVLQNAVTSLETILPIEFSLPSELPVNEVPVYIVMYFAELAVLESTEKRLFHMYINNKRITSTPISPPYGSVMELTFTNVTASSTTIFSLKATSDSTLPPIINAFEVFIYGGNSDNNGPVTNNDNNSDNSNSGNGSGGSVNTKTRKKSQTGKKKKSNNLPIILGTTSSSFLVIWAIVGALLISHYKKKSAIAKGQTGEDVMPNDTPNSIQHIMNNMTQS